MRLSLYILLSLTVVLSTVFAGCEMFGAGGETGSGTEETTLSMVADINRGSASSEPEWFQSLDGTLYFAASSSTSERNLWQTDGTNDGTVRASELTGHAVYGARPEYIEKYNDKLYMEANAGSEGRELMSYSEQEGGKLVEDINSNTVSGGGGTEDSYPSSLTTQSFLLGPKLLFFTAQDSADNIELWAYDGNSPYQVKEINSNGSSSPYFIVSGNYQIFFSAEESNYGEELYTAYYSTDYQGNNYVKVERLSDIASGSASSDPEWLMMHNNTLYFAASDDSSDQELYYYETSADTFYKVDVNTNGSSSPKGFTEYKGKLLFQAKGGNGKGTELWSFSLSTGNVSLVKDINNGAGDSNPADLVEYNDKVYFSANGGNKGTELWVTDGTTEGTELFRDLNENGSSNPSDFYVFEDQLYFSASNGTDGAELWTLNAN